MRANLQSFSGLVLVTAVTLAVPAFAQAPPAPTTAAPGQKTLFERYSEPIQIFKNGLDTFSRPISSNVKEAQAFFDQGFQMMYSFAKPEAVRSFRESWKRDP